MLGCEGIEAASIERASLDIGERLAFERVLAVIVEIAHAVAGCANSDDLAASVIEGVRDRHDARPDLEERAHRGAGAKDGLVLLPVADATEGEHHLQTGVVERLAQVERPTNASVTRQAGQCLRPGDTASRSRRVSTASKFTPRRYQSRPNRTTTDATIAARRETPARTNVLAPGQFRIQIFCHPTA